MAEIILANLTDINGFGSNVVAVTGAAYNASAPGIFNVTQTAPFSFVLPAIVSVATGGIFVVKDLTGIAGSTNITITATGGLTIDGSSSLVINTNHGAYGIYSNGTNWSIMFKV